MATDWAASREGIVPLPRRERRNLYDIFFSPLTATFAATALVLSFFLPPDGLGPTICWFQNLFGHPCPGCGLTRSLTCISHGEFAKAWAYHPFGPVIYALFVANVLIWLMPQQRRSDLKQRMAGQERWLRPFYFAIVVLFLTYGVIRLLWSVLAV